MGFLSATEVHSVTDDLAARVVAGLAAFRSEQQPRTVATLFDLVDASADPVVQNALGAAALAVDEQGLPENLAAMLTTSPGGLAHRPNVKAMAKALSDLARSDAGGGYSNLAAALAAASAVVHPVYAEIERARTQESTFTISDDVTVVACPAYACIRPTRLYTGTNGSWTDDTTDAGDADAGDVALIASNGDKILIGSDRPFTQVIFGLSQVGSHDAAFTVKYWNGNAFVAVSGLTDNSVGLTKNQNIKWTIPADWTRTAKDGGGNALADKARLYYIEITRTAATLTTPPAATIVSLVPAPILNGSGLHLGVPASMPQPPLGLVRVTGNGTVVVEAPAAVAHTRFKEPAAAQLVLRALSPISGSVTLTLAYVDHAGANQSQAQSAWSSIDPLDTLAVALAGAGLRSVRTSGNSSVNTAVDGIFEISTVDIRNLAL